MVAAARRHAADPRGERRADAGRPRRDEVDQVVAALGERLDQLRDARDADPQAGVERDLDLGDRGQPPVDAGVGADHLDLVAGNAELADPLDRVA